MTQRIITIQGIQNGNHTSFIFTGVQDFGSGDFEALAEMMHQLSVSCAQESDNLNESLLEENLFKGVKNAKQPTNGI